MPSTVLDALTHGYSRRQSFSAPATAEDRKRKKKNKNNGGKKKIFARCTSQIPACEALAQESCSNDADCLAARTACCDSLASCDFTAFVTCFNNVSAP